jgi:hypothetical protein
MRSEFTVTVKLKNADVKVLEQIKREQYPDLPSVDTVVHIVALKGIQEEIYRQYGKNLARHMKANGFKNPDIKKELQEKDYNGETLKEIFKWLAEQLNDRK